MGLLAARRLHDRMTAAVLRATMGFFESTPRCAPSSPIIHISRPYVEPLSNPYLIFFESTPTCALSSSLCRAPIQSPI